jgi:hypothetical protein
MKLPTSTGRPGYAANLKIHLAKRMAALEEHDRTYTPPPLSVNVSAYQDRLNEATANHDAAELDVETATADLQAALDAMRTAESAYARGEGTGAAFDVAMGEHSAARFALAAAQERQAVAKAAQDLAEQHLNWANVVAGGAARRAALEREMAQELRQLELYMGGNKPPDHPSRTRKAARSYFLASVVSARRNITRYLPESERAAWEAETDALES